MPVASLHTHTHTPSSALRAGHGVAPPSVTARVCVRLPRSGLLQQQMHPGRSTTPSGRTSFARYFFQRPRTDGSGVSGGLGRRHPFPAADVDEQLSPDDSLQEAEPRLSAPPAPPPAGPALGPRYPPQHPGGRPNAKPRATHRGTGPQAQVRLRRGAEPLGLGTLLPLEPTVGFGLVLRHLVQQRPELRDQRRARHGDRRRLATERPEGPRSAGPPPFPSSSCFRSSRPRNRPRPAPAGPAAELAAARLFLEPPPGGSVAAARGSAAAQSRPVPPSRPPPACAARRRHFVGTASGRQPGAGAASPVPS